MLRQIPIIMLTILSDSNLGYRLGASEFMTKPVDRARLSEVLARYRSGPASRSALLVEDDEGTRRVTRALLEREGWSVRDASDGKAALDRIAERVPDLILLDLVMPGMDGFEFLEALRRRADGQAIPVVVITSKDLTEEERRRVSLGAQSFFQKGSLDDGRILAELHRVLSPAAPSAAAAPLFRFHVPAAGGG